MTPPFTESDAAANALLPELMSGEIWVKDAEKSAEAGL